MTHQERIKLLRKLNPNYISTPDYSVREIEEALNWAVKVCHKYASQRKEKSKHE